MMIHEYADREMLAINVANILAGALEKCLLVQDFVSFAVPGGSTPGPIFDMLSATDLDWHRVHVMLTDERWVDGSDPMSNAKLVRERLLTGPASKARFIPFHRPGQSASGGSAEVAQSLLPELPLSLLMLGMGEDMHTASLFPNADGLEQALAPDAPLLCAVQPVDQDIARVTLPAHVLDNAMEKHLIIFGDKKRAALETAKGLPAELAPIAAVAGDAQVHWAA